ncbi:MAG: sugar ABC transporter ATP-binding protein [Hyphomicrobiales bacterium]|nr:MAG: sugar ABC transporter ATP-binding protein [Hyphomicrobiales bacterium]
MSDLKLSDVRKSFGSLEVIKGVDLDIESGEFVVFVGPSGCGKSTLLRMIAGLEDITVGELHIGNVRMNDVDPSKRGIAMVFQSYALYPHMTVRENMGFALKFGGMNKADVAKQVQDAADILGLDELLDRKPATLSGGQRQRVAIGRAIVRHPDVFLFDEPLSNLDAELRVHMRVELARLHKQLATTIIYVTHDQVEAMTLADKIVVLRDGIVEQFGKPLELYDDPDNKFVAGFIGSPKMNFLNAVILKVSATSCNLKLIDFNEVSFDLPVNGDNLAVGAQVSVGIRPEHFTQNADVEFSLTVDLLEHLGGQSFIYARSDGNETLVLETQDGRNIKNGDRINVGFDKKLALLFDANDMRVR